MLVISRNLFFFRAGMNEQSLADDTADEEDTGFEAHSMLTSIAHWLRVFLMVVLETIPTFSFEKKDRKKRYQLPRVFCNLHVFTYRIQ